MAKRKSNQEANSRKLPSGMWARGRIYYARFKKNGRVIRKRLSADYRVACQMLNDLKARVDRGDYGILDNDLPFGTTSRRSSCSGLSSRCATRKTM